MVSFIETSDLERGVEREFGITPRFLRMVLARSTAGDQQTLDECMRVAADVTAITYREMAFVIFSELSEGSIRSNYLLHKLAVPNLGDMKSVKNPILDNVVYSSFFPERRIGTEVCRRIYVPIVHLHTHPGVMSNGKTFPSKADLDCALIRYNTEMNIKGIKLNVLNPELQVISTSGGFAFSGNLPISSQLFYQFTGDYKAFEKFIGEYDSLFKSCSSDPKRFAKEMQRSRAFKAEYFEPGELVEHYSVKGENGLGIGIKKKNLDKLVRKFAYTLRICRIY